MSFLILSNADILFVKKKLTWRSYITAEALSTIKWIKLIDKKKFAKEALNENVRAFMVYITSFSLSWMRTLKFL